MFFGLSVVSNMPSEIVFIFGVALDSKSAEKVSNYTGKPQVQIYFVLMVERLTKKVFLEMEGKLLLPPPP